MRYVDGYVLVVPKKKLAAYRKMASEGGEMWTRCGALQYVECVGDDMAVKWGVPFPKAVKAKPGEVVIFAFVVFKTRAHRDRVNAKVMRAMEKLYGKDHEPADMPFDMKRMQYGGFKTLVDL